MTTHPARDSRTERWLDSIGVRWSFIADLPLARIDLPASLANQVRRKPLDPEVVERYAHDMRQGDTFPPLIVHRDAHAILGGNHRHAAHVAANHTTAPAYLVTGDPATLLRIAVEDNRNHGLPTTPAERLDHACALVEAGIAHGDAARIVGIPAPKLTSALGARRALARLDGDPVADTFAKLPASTRYELSRIDDDAVLAEAATLTIAAGLSAGDVRSLVDAVNATHDEEAMRLIGQAYEDHDERIRDRAGAIRKRGAAGRSKLEQALATIAGLTPADLVASCPNDDVKAILAQRIMTAARVLQETHAGLTARSKAQAA